VLEARCNDESGLIAEHARWALSQLMNRHPAPMPRDT
jgi:hypothetical protein